MAFVSSCDIGGALGDFLALNLISARGDQPSQGLSPAAAPSQTVGCSGSMAGWCSRCCNSRSSPKQQFCERLIETVVLGMSEPSYFHNEGCSKTNHQTALCRGKVKS